MNIKLRAAFFLSLASLIVSACTIGNAGSAEFSLTIASEPTSLDPSLVAGSVDVQLASALFEGLVINDPKTGEPINGLAESWTLSPDKTEYTFKLRPAQWSDARPLTANDVVQSWLRVIDPASDAQYAWLPVMFVKGAAEYHRLRPEASSKEALAAARSKVAVKALDDKTFWFKLAKPMPYALSALTHPAFSVVPVHVIEKHGRDWTLAENLVTAAAFKLKEWKPKEKIVLIKNSNYWDAENVKINQVNYLLVENASTAWNLLVQNKVDWINTVPFDKLDEARSRKDFRNSPLFSSLFYVFNLNDELLNKRLLRQAISAAIDRQKLVDQVSRGSYIPAYSLVPSLAANSGIAETTFDLEKAKALLAQAGYPQGKGLPEITLLYNNASNHQLSAQFVQAQLGQIGVKVVLKSQEWNSFLESRRANKFQIARSGWIGEYLDPFTFLEIFQSSSPLNVGAWLNKEFDALLAKSDTMELGKERLEVLAQAEKILVDQEQAVIPLYFNTTNNMIDTSKWGGWYENIIDIHNPRFFYKM